MSPKTNITRSKLSLEKAFAFGLLCEDIRVMFFNISLFTTIDLVFHYIFFNLYFVRVQRVAYPLSLAFFVQIRRIFLVWYDFRWCVQLFSLFVQVSQFASTCSQEHLDDRSTNITFPRIL